MKTKDKRLFSRLPTALVLLALAWAPSGLAQEPHPFGGFTLMEIRRDEIHQAVGINPAFVYGKATLLLTMIAGNRSYASITKGHHQYYPDCITWIRQEEGTPDQVVLGDGDDWRFSKSGFPSRITGSMPPHICAEFRLQKLGPKQALFIKGDLRVGLPIVANYPILSIDWSDPSLSRFRIDGYGLGPVTKDDATKLYHVPPIERAEREARVHGRLKRLNFLSQGDRSGFSGRALADVDRLISEGKAEIASLSYRHFGSNVGSKGTFYEAMLGRYGMPTAVIDARPGYGRDMVWAHDLHGRLLSEGEDSNDPCLKRLAEDEYTVAKGGYPLTEIGMWSCGVVMTLFNVRILRQDTIVNYHIRLRHGHAMAHHFFSDRLDVVEAARGRVPKRPGQPPDTVSPPPTPEEKKTPGARGRRGR